MTRRELVLLGLVVAVGAGLRFVAASHSAVEHFDEGVYASNLWIGEPDYAWPDRHLYAPPLLPALIETGMTLGVPPNAAALLPSLLAGCATIAALWWLGRTWFSPGVGLAAATLCALSDFHIAYSATALTDVLLGLWVLLAVQAGGLSLWKGDFRWAIAAGLLTGLAWWTKYNGWLPLAIEAAALPLLWIAGRGTGREPLPAGGATLARQFGCLAVTALVAAAVWSPHYLSLRSFGGYGAVATNHAKYAVGFAGWFDSLTRQLAAQHVLQTWLSLAGAVAAIVVPALCTPRKSSRAVPRLVGNGALLVPLLGLGQAMVLAGIAAPAGFVTGLLAARLLTDGQQQRRETIGLSLLGAWWSGLSIATFCYWPYPRLMLPWFLASWLLTAVCWRQLAAGWSDRLLGLSWFPRILMLLLFVAATGSLAMQHSQTGDSLPGRDRRGLVAIAQRIRSDVDSRTRRVFYVHGEPALLFQLRTSGEPLVIATQLKAAPPMDYYMAFGPHSLGDPAFLEAWERQRQRWELVASHAYVPSQVTWLDLYDPRKRDIAHEQRRNRIEVYRLRTAP